MKYALLLLAITLIATGCSKKEADKAGVTPNAMTTSQPEAASTTTTPAAASTTVPKY